MAEYIFRNWGYILGVGFTGVGIWDFMRGYPWWGVGEVVFAVVIVCLYQCPRSPWYHGESGVEFDVKVDVTVGPPPKRVIQVEPPATSVDMTKSAETEHDPMTCETCKGWRGEA